MSSPIKIFIAYSRKDSILMEKLRTHLRPLERAKMAKIWYDGIIEAGKNWENEIKTHLHNAEIILLLISADFIDSDYCYDEEMMDALKKHEQKKAKVIPIILRPCAWKFSPFAKLQVLPKDGKPVIEHEDYAFTDIVESVGNICQNKINLQKAASKTIDEMLLKQNQLKDKKAEEKISYFDTPEMKETQSLVDSILSGEFFAKSPALKRDNSFTDPRDGQIYKTVKLKDGKIWMAQNFNFDVGDGCCFYNNEVSNGPKYGRLYNWKAAQKACPLGWHLPSSDEWDKMIGLYGTWEANEFNFSNTKNRAAFSQLISKGSSGFSVQFGGTSGMLNPFQAIGMSGQYWSSTPFVKTAAFVYQFEFPLKEIYRIWLVKTRLFSCRYIKNS